MPGGKPGRCTPSVAWPTSTTTRRAPAELGQRTLRLAEALGDAWLTGWALHLLGLAAYIGGEYGVAEAYYERCLTLRRELGHLEGLFIALHLKGVAVYRLGRAADTLELVREALDIARELNSIWFYTCLLPIFAGLAAERQPRRAARLGGAVIAMSESAQTLPIPITQAFFEETMPWRATSSARRSSRYVGARPGAVAGGGADRGRRRRALARWRKTLPGLLSCRRGRGW